MIRRHVVDDDGAHVKAMSVFLREHGSARRSQLGLATIDRTWEIGYRIEMIYAIGKKGEGKERREGFAYTF